MRRQCQLVKIQEGQIQHKGGTAVTVRLYTHVNKHRPHAAAYRAAHTPQAPLWSRVKAKVKQYGHGPTGAPPSA